MLKMKSHIQIKPLSIVIAAAFLSVFGAVWYGVLFNDIQQESHRFTAEEYAASHPAWYMGGVVISLFIAWGLALLIRLGGIAGIRAGVKASVRAAIGFGLPLVTYPLVFSPLHDFKLYAVGFFQIVIAWIVAGAILGAMARYSEP